MTENRKIVSLITEYVNQPFCPHEHHKGEKCYSYDFRKGKNNHEPETARDIIENAIKMWEEHKLAVCEQCGYFNASCGIGCRFHKWYRLGDVRICERCQCKREKQEHRVEHLKKAMPFNFNKEDEVWLEEFLLRAYTNNKLSHFYKKEITPEIRQEEKEQREYVNCLGRCEIMSRIK